MMNHQEYGPPNQQPMYNTPPGQGGYSPQSPQQFNDDPREQPQNSNYVFSTNTGSVNVTLPSDSTFHVDAKTDTGSFNSDFPVSNTDKQGLGSEVHGDVGNSPTTTITLNTNTGSINLNQSK